MPDRYKNRFKWLPTDRFRRTARQGPAGRLARLMLKVLKQCGEWDPKRDAKLDRLVEPSHRKHSEEKVLIFTQFADTVAYLKDQLESPRDRPGRGGHRRHGRPDEVAWRFSPDSNDKRNEVPRRPGAASSGRHRCPQRRPEPSGCGDRRQLRPSLGHHPADPAGRPRGPHRPEGRQRSSATPSCRPTASSGSSGCEPGSGSGSRRMPRSSAPTRRSSRTTATTRPSATCSTRRPASSTARPTPKSTWPPTPTRSGRTPSTRTRPWNGSSRTCPTSSTRPRAHTPTEREPEGVLALCPHCAGQRRPGLGGPERPERHRIAVRHPQGRGVRAEHPALPRRPDHHDLVRKGVESIAAEEKTVGGQLGRPSGARFRTYERLKRYAEEVKGTLFDSQSLEASHRGYLQLPPAPGGRRHTQPPAPERYRGRRAGQEGGRAARGRPAVLDPRG